MRGIQSPTISWNKHDRSISNDPWFALHQNAETSQHYHSAADLQPSVWVPGEHLAKHGYCALGGQAASSASAGLGGISDRQKEARGISALQPKCSGHPSNLRPIAHSRQRTAEDLPQSDELLDEKPPRKAASNWNKGASVIYHVKCAISCSSCTGTNASDPSTKNDKALHSSMGEMQIVSYMC